MPLKDLTNTPPRLEAAFGGGHGDGDVSSEGESVSMISGTSSTRKKAAFKAAFPVKGIDCVGCALVKKIAPVEKFIKDNMNKMAEEGAVEDGGAHLPERSAGAEKARGCSQPRRARFPSPSHCHHGPNALL